MRRDELNILVDIHSAMLDTSLDLANILNVILINSLKLIPQTHAEILLLENSGKQLRIVRSTDVHDEGKMLDVDKCFTGLAIKKSITAYCCDSKTEPLYQSPYSGPYKCELTVPLCISSKVIGAINIESNKVDAFDQDAIKSVEYLGGLASIAILNAGRLSELERAQDRLIEIDNKVLGGMNNFIVDRSHELGNKLSAIRSDLLSISKSEVGKVSKKMNSVLESAISRFDAIFIFADQSEKLLTQYVTTEKVNLNLEEVIEKCIEDFLPKPYNIKIETSIAYNLRLIRGSQIRIEDMIREFLTNSIAAMPNGGTIKVTAHNEGNSVVFFFEDDGIGIPQHIMDQLYNVGSSSKNHKGLGLFSIYMIVKTHKGNISCNSIVGKGTTFKVIFPAVI